MISNELLSFVSTHLQAGDTYEKIEQDLTKGGWSKQDIKEVYQSLHISPPKSIKITPIIIGLVFLFVIGGSVFAAYHFNIIGSFSKKLPTTEIASNSSTNENKLENSEAPTEIINNQEKEIAEERIVMSLILARGLATYKQKTLGMSYGAVCTDSELVEIINDGIDRSNRNGFSVEIKDFNCFGSTSFVANLPLPNGGYFCVDSYGFADIVTDISSGGSCGTVSSVYKISENNREKIKEAEDLNLSFFSKETQDSLKKKQQEVILERERTKLQSLPAKIELDYDKSGTYSNACSFAPTDIVGLVCNDTATSWVASYPFSQGGYICVDAQGATGHHVSSKLIGTSCPTN